MKIPKSQSKKSQKTASANLAQDQNLKDLQIKIGLTFSDQTLLKNAFIHRSYLNEHKNFRGTSNERLEFLGDSVISVIVSRYLFEKLRQSPEGELTQLRAALVRTETLAKIARKLNLGNYLLLSKGEEDSEGRHNSSILANTFEALIGAIYLDKGFEHTEKFLAKMILGNWQTLAKSAVSDNKSKLQEILQRKYHQSPTYKLISTWGPDHDKKFQIGVYLSDKLLGKGLGRNKQQAAQKAAENVLAKIAVDQDTTTNLKLDS